jgi:hypothetical protein
MIMLNSKFVKASGILKKLECLYLVRDISVNPPGELKTDLEKYEADRNLKHFLAVILEADLKVLDKMIEKQKLKGR